MSSIYVLSRCHAILCARAIADHPTCSCSSSNVRSRARLGCSGVVGSALIAIEDVISGVDDARAGTGALS